MGCLFCSLLLSLSRSLPPAGSAASSPDLSAAADACKAPSEKERENIQELKTPEKIQETNQSFPDTSSKTPRGVTISIYIYLPPTIMEAEHGWKDPVHFHQFLEGVYQFRQRGC